MIATDSSENFNIVPRAAQHGSRAMTPEPMEEVFCQLIGVNINHPDFWHFALTALEALAETKTE